MSFPKLFEGARSVVKQTGLLPVFAKPKTQHNLGMLVVVSTCLAVDSAESCPTSMYWFLLSLKLLLKYKKGKGGLMSA